MGKPLGLGSVKISVTNIHSRKIIKDKEKGAIQYDEHLMNERPGDYGDILDWPAMGYHELECSETVFNEFLQITGTGHHFETIEYPNIEEKPENYLWFVANKQVEGTGTKPVIAQMLPPIDSPWLKKYKEKQQQR